MKVYTVERKFDDFERKEFIDFQCITDAVEHLVDTAVTKKFDALYLYEWEIGQRKNLLLSYYPLDKRSTTK